MQNFMSGDSSFNIVHAGSPVIIIVYKQANKQVQGESTRKIRNLGIIKIKSNETNEVVYISSTLFQSRL